MVLLIVMPEFYPILMIGLVVNFMASNMSNLMIIPYARDEVFTMKFMKGF